MDTSGVFHARAVFCTKSMPCAANLQDANSRLPSSVPGFRFVWLCGYCGLCARKLRAHLQFPASSTQRSWWHQRGGPHCMPRAGECAAKDVGVRRGGAKAGLPSGAAKHGVGAMQRWMLLVHPAASDWQATTAVMYASRAHCHQLRWAHHITEMSTTTDAKVPTSLVAGTGGHSPQHGLHPGPPVQPGKWSSNTLNCAKMPCTQEVCNRGELPTGVGRPVRARQEPGNSACPCSSTGAPS